MTRRRWLFAAAAAVAVMGIALLAAAPSGGAGPSVLSRGSAGWLVAHRYLAETGAEVVLRDRPFTGSLVGDVVVVAFPVQRRLADDLTALDRFLVAGGTLVWAYSGSVPRPSENWFAQWLGLDLEPVLEGRFLSPRRWWRHASEPWRLEPAATFGPGRPVQISAPYAVPVPPSGAATLYRGPDGEAALFSFERGRGRVVVLPAQALANCRLGHPGNADLLASLRQWLGPSWVFDEYRHGLSAPRSAADRAPLLAFDLLGIHLAVFYLLAVVALAMRFGPPWKVDSRVPGSTAAFLVGLGRLHDRLGHHTEAARLLVERVGEFDVRVPLPERVGGEGRSGLLRLARELGRRQEVAGAGAGSGSGGA